MFHSIFYIISSMAVGYIVYSMLYWKHNHALVKMEIGVLSAYDLMVVLFVVGLFLSLI